MRKIVTFAIVFMEQHKNDHPICKNLHRMAVKMFKRNCKLITRGLLLDHMIENREKHLLQLLFEERNRLFSLAEVSKIAVELIDHEIKKLKQRK